MTTRKAKKMAPARTRKKPRLPVALKSSGAVDSILAVVLDRITKDPVVMIALASFLEGRRLSGEWKLRITGVELVPVADPVPIREGVVTPD
jgi:hypothetical protein